MNEKIRQLYKTLVYLGKDYPAQSGGYPKFIQILKNSFRNTEINNSEDLQKALARGDYIIKELEALYFLTRYRDMKRKYYND